MANALDSLAPKTLLSPQRGVVSTMIERNRNSVSNKPPLPAAVFAPIDHTADVGYRLAAPTLAELFAVAGRALFDAITALESIQPRLARQIQVEAGDVEALFVTWLSELNFYCLTEFELYGDFTIEAISPTAVRATVRGEKIDPARHVIHTEIKAVTYHELYVRQVENGWEAQVIFDV
ncbi:MAG: Protein archease [bacterium]|nr:Protein archease [bacterium]